MTRCTLGFVLAAAAVAGCGEDPIQFVDAGPDVDATVQVDAPVAAQCGDGVRVAGEVCLGEGSGLATVNAPADAHFADMDGDGDQDVVYRRSDSLVFHANTGGQLAETATVLFSTTYANHFAARDLDGDGKADVATSEFDGYAMWRSNGIAPELYQITGAVETAQGLRAVAYADLDGNGRTEVVVLGPDHVHVGVLDANLTLTEGTGVDLLATGGALAVGRFDADNRDDVVVGYSETLALWRGTAGPGLEALDGPPIPGGWHGVEAGDVDGDGKLDLFFSNDGATGVARGNGDGTFEEPFELPEGNGAQSIDVADFDGDGRDDLAVLSTKNVLSLWLGQADGSMVFVVSATGSGWSDTIHVGGDLNGDGAPDLVLNDGESQLVTVILQDP